ncbi:pyridoxal phosphate-dependent transferase, partial [Mrakia frigida]|uniref:pyridoxal phosphate-dependent transferase n=1 Tax=Mrakia frigida TaxID=29902 RepID=UPI003FCBF3BC
MSSPPLDLPTEVFPNFPALSSSSFVFGDNAGGSQILGACVDALTDFLLCSNVQLGGAYPLSLKAAGNVSEGAKATATLMNASSEKDIVFGSSTTALITNLAYSLETGDWLNEGDEIVVTDADHEANIGPWLRLARNRGLVVRWWKTTVTPALTDSTLQLSTLAPLLSSKTKIVAFTACSNILGQSTPIKQVVDLVREKTDRLAKTCVDCVAYAPHQRMDVTGWGVDFAVFSYYKVFAPHLSVLYVSPSAVSSLSSLGHYFHPKDPAHLLAPGGASYELVHSVSRVLPYLLSLSSLPSSLSSSDHLVSAFSRISAHECALGERLLGWLGGEEGRGWGVRVVGPGGMGEENGRSAVTVAFVIVESDERGEGGEVKLRLKSGDVVKRFDEGGKIGIKYGHFYASRLLASLGFGTVDSPSEDGCIRISLVHYNTLDEVDQFLEQLKEVIRP